MAMDQNLRTVELVGKESSIAYQLVADARRIRCCVKLIVKQALACCVVVGWPGSCRTSGQVHDMFTSNYSPRL